MKTALATLWATESPGDLLSIGIVRDFPMGVHSSTQIRIPVRQIGTVFEIPLLGSIPAGFGREREQESDECIPVTIESIGFKPTRSTFALRVVGDSMIGRHICDGDIAVLEHGPEPRSGQVVAALIDRKNTLKTFVVRNGKPFLKAENPKLSQSHPVRGIGDPGRSSGNHSEDDALSDS